MNWLVLSLVLSVVLTVILNVAVRAFPDAPRRFEDRLARSMPRESGVRVFFPWKTMLVGSIVLTVLLNILLRL